MHVKVMGNLTISSGAKTKTILQFEMLGFWSNCSMFAIWRCSVLKFAAWPQHKTRISNQSYEMVQTCYAANQRLWTLACSSNTKLHDAANMLYSKLAPFECYLLEISQAAQSHSPSVC